MNVVLSLQAILQILLDNNVFHFLFVRDGGKIIFVTFVGSRHSKLLLI
jgi:hypothetical protein